MDFERLMVWMEPWIDPAFQSPPFDPEVAREILSAAGRSADDHRALLQRRNGFYALGGLLHVLGACQEPPNHSLRAWNHSEGWRRAWGRLPEGLTFFAQDAFGNQFAYRAGKIVRFRVLSGKVEAMYATLREWLEAVILEPDYLLNRRAFQACVQRHGPLPYGGHFCPTTPLVDGAPIDPEHVEVLPTRDSMERQARVVAQPPRRPSSLRLAKV